MLPGASRQNSVEHIFERDSCKNFEIYNFHKTINNLVELHPILFDCFVEQQPHPQKPKTLKSEQNFLYTQIACEVKSLAVTLRNKIRVGWSKRKFFVVHRLWLFITF